MSLENYAAGLGSKVSMQTPDFQPEVREWGPLLENIGDFPFSVFFSPNSASSPILIKDFHCFCGGGFGHLKSQKKILSDQREKEPLLSKECGRIPLFYLSLFFRCVAPKGSCSCAEVHDRTEG